MKKCTLCYLSVVKNEFQKVMQYRKAHKRKNALNQQPKFFKDLKVIYILFMHCFNMHLNKQITQRSITIKIKSMIAKASIMSLREDCKIWRTLQHGL